jgi:hypothetical protein
VCAVEPDACGCLGDFELGRDLGVGVPLFVSEGDEHALSGGEGLEGAGDVDAAEGAIGFVERLPVLDLGAVVERLEGGAGALVPDQAECFVAGDLQAPREGGFGCPAGPASSPGPGQGFLHDFFGVVVAAEDADGLHPAAGLDQGPVPVIGGVLGGAAGPRPYTNATKI